MPDDPGRVTIALPIAACRLDGDGLRVQAGRYRRLGAASTAVEVRDGVLTATFGDALDEALLAEAIAVERECCPFFAFDYDADARVLRITVASAAQAPALDALEYALAAGTA